MRRFMLAIALAGLTLSPIRVTEGGSLQLTIDERRVTIQSDDVELGQILEALRQQTGIRVLLDEHWAMQRVTAALEAQGTEELIWQLLRRTGGSNYVVLYSQGAGEFEGVRLTEGGTRTTSLEVRPSSPLPDFRENRRGKDHFVSSGAALPSRAKALPPVANPRDTGARPSLPGQAASVEPAYIPPVTKPAYFAPQSSLVHFPEVLPPVYVPSLKEPQYVPELPKASR